MPPFAEGDLVRCGGDCVQGRTHFSFALGHELEVVLSCVELPLQNRLLGGPGCISLPELLCRDRLLTEAVGIYVRSEDFVDAPKTVAEHLSSLCGAALASGDKFVQVDVYLGQGVLPLLGGGQRPLFVVGRRWRLVVESWLVGQLFEGVGKGPVAFGHGCISHIDDRLRRSTEKGRAVHVSHWEG